jgi:hypothetical protein
MTRYHEIIESLDPGMPDLPQIQARLAAVLGRDVVIAPRRLPRPCANIWARHQDVEHIGYNRDWPIPVIEVIAHTVGHLIQGHCETVRADGRLACLRTRSVRRVTRSQVRVALRGPDAVPRPLFDGAAERDAEHFAVTLLDRLGYRGTADCSGPVPAFTCVGYTHTPRSFGGINAAVLAGLLEEFLSRPVTLSAVSLPAGCAGSWSGTGDLSCSTHFPALAAEAIGHTAGHVFFGHMPDDGPFTCALARSAHAAEARRLFSPDQEQQAGRFTTALLRMFGKGSFQDWGAPVFTCTRSAS